MLWDVTIAVGSKQRIRIRPPQRNGLQSKRPRPGVSESGLTVVAAMVSHLAEHTRDVVHSNSGSISPYGTSRKGKVAWRPELR